MENLFENHEAQNENKEVEAVLVSVFSSDEDERDREASLEELGKLLETAGGRIYAKMIQTREHPENATYIGKGKLAELSELCKAGEVKLVICDDELSPVQIRNMEKELGGDVTVIDRTMLILDIFALHATTSDGKLQVELAQLKYTAPRLIGKGKELSRLGGGIGTRGPGESKLEIDRRRIKEREHVLEKRLEELEKNREMQRKQRKRSGIFRFAIAGYTNAGKSTLLNALTGAGVKEKDELFATLDPTTRKFELPSGTEILFTDTVGFIRNLPHHLVKAFRSTLREVADCDAILLVIDASDSEADAQLKVTTELLRQLGAADKPIIYLLNKCDKADFAFLSPIEREKSDSVLKISAKNGDGLDELIALLEETSSKGKRKATFRIPASDLGVIAGLYAEAQILDVTYNDDGAIVTAEADEKVCGRLKKYLTE